MRCGCCQRCRRVVVQRNSDGEGLCEGYDDRWLREPDAELSLGGREGGVVLAAL